MVTLTLEIVPSGEPHSTMTSYRVRDDQGRLVFVTRAYTTPEGTQGARERLRAWCRKTGNKLVLAAGEQRRVGKNYIPRGGIFTPGVNKVDIRVHIVGDSRLSGVRPLNCWGLAFKN